MNNILENEEAKSTGKTQIINVILWSLSMPLQFLKIALGRGVGGPTGADRCGWRAQAGRQGVVWFLFCCEVGEVRVPTLVACWGDFRSE